MSESQRIIAHFDLDAFFVSVECIHDPSLKGKPLIVGGRERGVVAACSYEARAYGIHSAMPMKTAMRLCPHATVVGGTRGEYSKFSRWVTQIIADKAPLFEKASIDEFYLDLTGMGRFFDPFKWTIELRQDNMMTGCIAVKIRYGDFETTSRQTTIPYTFYDDELILQARDLFHKLWRKGQPIRLLGVRLSELTDEALQTNLFTDAEKKAGLYKAIDEVKNRFGTSSITKATGK